MKTKFVFDFDS
nr:4.9 kDa non-structural protein [Bovine coronavirus]